MLINEERDDMDDEPEPGCFERFFLKMGIGNERYNQILVFIQVSVPLLIGLGIIIGVLLWIRTESFSKFILVRKIASSFFQLFINSLVGPRLRSLGICYFSYCSIFMSLSLDGWYV
jgi:hypothetical protein